MWELKEEYRHYKQQTADSSNWFIQTAPADDGGATVNPWIEAHGFY